MFLLAALRFIFILSVRFIILRQRVCKDANERKCMCSYIGSSSFSCSTSPVLILPLSTIMSMAMIMAAMAEGDDNQDAEEVRTQATSQPILEDTADAPVADERNQTVTPQKRKRKEEAPSTRKQAKKKPIWEVCTMEKPTDQKIYCLFEGKQCIPLWPQYTMKGKAKGKFIKVSPAEKWLQDVTHSQRRARRKGLDPSVLSTMMTVKESNSVIC